MEPRRVTAVLLAVAGASELLYVWLARLAPGNGLRDVVFFLGISAAQFLLYAIAYRVLSATQLRKADVLLVFAAAAIFRLTLVPAGLPRDTAWRDVPALLLGDLRGREVVFESHLLFDNDHWRYLWDGHVAAHGFSPFQYAPADPRLDAIADGDVWAEIRSNVNHPELTTIYPPAAQLFFRVIHAVAPGSVVALKLAVIGVDMLAVWLLWLVLSAVGRPGALLLLYAWNPLVIKVFAGSAHFDVLLVAAIAAMLWFAARSLLWPFAAAWACAVAVKLAPLVMIPAMVRRSPLRAGAAVAALTFLFVLSGVAGVTGSAAFASGWEFHDGAFKLMKFALSWTDRAAELARIVVVLLVGVTAVLVARRDDGSFDRLLDSALLPLGVLLLAGPVFMPWYLTWLLPFAVAGGRTFWFQLSAIAYAAFFVMIDGRERVWILAVEWLLILALLAFRRARLTER